MSDELAGRSYAQVYRVSGRSYVHEYLRSTVERAGGEVLFMSPANRAPVYLGIQRPNDERIGVLCYPFRCNAPPIRGRAPDVTDGLDRASCCELGIDGPQVQTDVIEAGRPGTAEDVGQRRGAPEERSEGDGMERELHRR